MGKHSKNNERYINNINTEFENIDIDETKKKSLKFDIVLFVSVILLSLFGILVIYSATRFSLPDATTDPMFYFKKQIISLIVSIVAFVCLIAFDYRKLKKIWVIVYLLSISSLIIVLFLGYEVNSTKGWIDLKFTNIQPSEFSKIFMIVCVAAVFSKWRSEKKSFVGFKKVILSFFIAFSIIIL
ncbi:MAG: FtsW/RodA/SpoVE family cell cycle protein, partial [Actinomycetota bacterium]|nr:FtsW/RodA/SpoVE family cell cycle protein [Actinomycetota bacterium]